MYVRRNQRGRAKPEGTPFVAEGCAHGVCGKYGKATFSGKEASCETASYRARSPHNLAEMPQEPECEQGLMYCHASGGPASNRKGCSDHFVHDGGNPSQH